MRAPSPRPFAVLALCGVALAALVGCGKGAGSGGAAGGGAGGASAHQAHGVAAIVTKNTTRLGGADAVDGAAAVAQTIYPGLTPATRPQAAVLVDERDWASALAASSLAAAPLGAPLLFADGNELPEASEHALGALRPLGSPALGGAQVISIGASGAVPAGYRATALGGSTAETPAAEAGARAAVDVLHLLETARGHRPREVIVVALDTPKPLQMPAASLAAESGAPILFISRTSVPAATRAALERLQRPTIYVMAPKTLGATAYAALERLGTVVHVTGEAGPGEGGGQQAGEEAVENAISVSRFSRGTFGWGIHEAGHGLVFANVGRPLDAPAAAPLSAHGDYGPLLLLQSSASLPAALTRYLSNIEPGYTAAVPPVREVYNHGWLIGDEDAISALAQAELDAVLEIAPRQPSAAEESVAEAE